jgi:hypothetical protein
VAFTIGGDLALFDLGAYNHARAYAVASYGFASGTVRYALGALRPLGGGGRTTVGYEFHDLTATDDLHRAQGLDEAPGSVIAFERSADYFRRLGHEAYLFVRLADRLQVGLAWRSDRYGSLAVETGSSDPNPPVAEGLMRSAIASARFSTGRVFPDREDERRSFLQRDLFNAFREPPPGLRGEATFEWASPGTLGGDFAFRRLLVSLRGRAGGSRLSVDARGILGFTWGDPPEQKRLSLGGFGRLRGYPFAALPGADVALGTVECRLDAARALPRLIAFYDGGIAWGTGATDGAFKHSLGVGLKWPAEAPFFVRVDFARALGDPSVRGARTLARLQLPF